MFDMDPRELIRFRKIMKKRADKLSVATGIFLNELAFKTREFVMINMHADLIIRNPSLLRKQMQVNKAPLRVPISVQQSEVGSVRVPRTTGFREQEYGGKDPRERNPTLNARTGNVRRKVSQSVRMKPGVKFPRSTNIKGRWTNSNRQAQVFLFQQAREGRGKPFIVEGHNKLKYGLYRFRGRKLKMLQDLSPEQDKIKRTNWMTRSVSGMRSKVNKRTLWKHALNKVRI